MQDNEVYIYRHYWHEEALPRKVGAAVAARKFTLKCD